MREKEQHCNYRQPFVISNCLSNPIFLKSISDEFEAAKKYVFVNHISSGLTVNEIMQRKAKLQLLVLLMVFVS